MQAPPLERWFDDFTPGEVFEFGRYTVTAEEIIDFARRWDPQPFHLSEEAGRASHFGGLVASGWMSGAVLMRLMCDHFISVESSMGSPGIDQMRWLKPVRPGDVLRARVEVLSMRPSASKPDRGVIHFAQSLINQRDEVVMTILGMGMKKRRPA